MPIEKMTILYRPKKPRPREGDTKTKNGKLFVRRQVIVSVGSSRACLVNNGKPVFEWVAAQEDASKTSGTGTGAGAGAGTTSGAGTGTTSGAGTGAGAGMGET